MSQYTGRIHLYSCISGEDSRPRPMFENFRPEELEALNSPAANSIKETAFNSLKDNPAYVQAILAFIEEWKKLRPIEQKRLLGKPLQLPLTVELCYLCEGINHDIRVQLYKSELCWIFLCWSKLAHLCSVHLFLVHISVFYRWVARVYT